MVTLDTGHMEWQPVAEGEDPHTALLTTIMIDGVSHFISAYEVEEKDHVQMVKNQDYSEEFDALCGLSGAQGRFQTVRIDGREYVLGMAPYC